MSKLFIFITIFLFLLFNKANSQNNQIISNNTYTTPIDFGTGCAYKWTNDNPAIGLAASGTGNIASFKAINTGNTSITATIIASPISAGFAYVPNYHDTTVSVFSTDTYKVVATIPIAPALYGVTISPDSKTVYVASLANGTVSVINTATNTVNATIETLINPINLSISRDGKFLYVANEAGSISIFNTATNILKETIPVNSPYGIALSPDGNMLYLTNLGNGIDPGTVTVINVTTKAVLTTITVGTYPGNIAMSPDGKFVYVASILNLNDGSGIMSVINTATNKIETDVSIGDGGSDIVVSPDGSKIYTRAVNFDGATPSSIIQVINPFNNFSIHTIHLDGEVTGLCLNPDGSVLYAENFTYSNVSAINTTTETTIASVPVGADPNSSGNFVTASFGCSIYPLRYTITVNPSNPDSIFIPNTFTPNADGINDTWDVKNLNTYPNANVNIFNRYGEKVYSSIGYGIPWDGTYHGSILPSGTYYYIIDLKNGDKNLSGSLTIIR